MPLDTSKMTPAEAREHIERLGISQQSFARMIHASPQNVRKWLKLDGTANDIPRAVQIMLRLLTPAQAKRLIEADEAA